MFGHDPQLEAAPALQFQQGGPCRLAFGGIGQRGTHD